MAAGEGKEAMEAQEMPDLEEQGTVVAVAGA
jgi:hypothetical protein